MKISTITLHNVLNYGSVLQAFATQKIFEQMGYEADFINYRRKDMISLHTLIKQWCKDYSLVKKIAAYPLLFISLGFHKHKFQRFINEHLNVQEQLCVTEDDFKKLPLNSDIYCTGSDQTWNSGWNNGILSPLFLSFVPDTIKKIAYSASFGKNQLDEWEKNETRKLLNRYQAISVRESSGVDIINNLGISDSVHVLDPTLQLDRIFWKQYIGDRKYKAPYVLIYQLNTNKNFDKYAKEYAKRKGCKLIRFCLRFEQMLKCGKGVLLPEIFDFVNLIYHADTVITDSFHATAFSINMNTNFISIYPNDYGSRLASILKLLRLENRHLTSYSDFSFVSTKPIDFAPVNNILEREREIGYKFLEKALKS